MKLRTIVPIAAATAAILTSPLTAVTADAVRPSASNVAVTQVSLAAQAAPIMTVDASSPYSNIVAVQFLLNAWGVATTADGSWGPKTIASIRTFQTQKKLTVDGSAGPLTMKALTNTTGFAGSPNLNTTKAVQQLLVKLGYHVDVDGSFGPATTAAVEAYQKRVALPQSGRVDSSTWAYLFEPPAPSTGWQACSNSINAGIPISQTGVATNNIRVASCLVPDVDAMVAAAAKAGVTLSTTSSWRSRDYQIALRKQDCGTSNYDIYQKPPSQCVPNTAIPGTSIHEFGLAIDVTSPGRAWMVAHGGGYGFHRTVPSEAWHFDTKQKPIS